MTTATQTQIRHDTASNIDAATPAAGELGWDTTNNRARGGDGAKQGGWHIPNHADIQNQAFKYAAAGGTANALTLTLAPVPAAYTDGMEIVFKATASNAAAATINVNGLGAKSLKKNVGGTLTDPAANDLASGVIYTATYDGTNFQFKADVAAGLTSVHQGDLNTSTGTVTITAIPASQWTSSNLTLPGGSYGFYPQFKTDGHSGTMVANLVGLEFSSFGPTVAYGLTTASTALTAYLTLSGQANTGFTTIFTAQQRYINSSPPFDLGDGPMHGFIFAKINKAGEIAASYVADVPPWAYNGPTDIRARHVCPITGKKFRIVPKRRSLDELLDGAKFEMAEPEEITQAHKNADMHLIPHPFPGALDPDHTIVLLDPLDDRLATIMAHYAHGGDDEVMKALHSGKIYAGNDFLHTRKGPPGVAIAPLCYKYSRK